MDTQEMMRQFDLLEKKVAALVQRCRSLEEIRSGLEEKVLHLQEQLKQKEDAERKFHELRSKVIEKVDRLIATIDMAADQ